MVLVDYLVASAAAVFAGLDRTAAFQFMISRPIVAAPLTGWLLGDPLIGLQVGALVELLWLGRLPVGAAIPPDDTQVAVGATAMAIAMGKVLELSGLPFAILSTLIALPLGKVGQIFERGARNRNARLLVRAEGAMEAGRLREVEFCHLRGLLHFALSSLATYAFIVLLGSWLLGFVGPHLIGAADQGADWLRVAFVLVGTAVILGTINVSRALSLFAASFATAFLMLWLL